MKRTEYYEYNDIYIDSILENLQVLLHSFDQSKHSEAIDYLLDFWNSVKKIPDITIQDLENIGEAVTYDNFHDGYHILMDKQGEFLCLSVVEKIGYINSMQLCVKQLYYQDDCFGGIGKLPNDVNIGLISENFIPLIEKYKIIPWEGGIAQKIVESKQQIGQHVKNQELSRQQLIEVLLQGDVKYLQNNPLSLEIINMLLDKIHWTELCASQIIKKIINKNDIEKKVLITEDFFKKTDRNLYQFVQWGSSQSDIIIKNIDNKSGNQKVSITELYEIDLKELGGLL